MPPPDSISYRPDMRHLALVLVTLLAPALVALHPAPVSAEQAEFDSAYVKVTLSKDGQSFVHPGFRIVKDEEGLFVIACSGKNHEVSVTLREASESRVSYLVRYEVDGRTLLSQEVEAEVGKPFEISKGETKLLLDVDPRGQKDTSRKDEDQIDQPDGDDPLGGM